MTHGDDRLAKSVRVMQIITGSCIIGAAAFAIVALIIVGAQNSGNFTVPARSFPILTLAAFLCLSVFGIVAVAAPRRMIRKAIQRMMTAASTPPAQPPSSDATLQADNLLALKCKTVVLTIGLLEASAVLGGIAYLKEAQSLSLIVVGWSMFCMLLSFPTTSQVRKWLEEHANKLGAARSGGGNS
jgi:hypothetical protein